MDTDDQSAQPILDAVSRLGQRKVRWVVAIAGDGSGDFYADHDYLAADVAMLLRSGADSLDPEHCLHTDAFMSAQPTCDVCGTAVRKGAVWLE